MKEELKFTISLNVETCIAILVISSTLAFLIGICSLNYAVECEENRELHSKLYQCQQQLKQ